MAGLVGWSMRPSQSMCDHWTVQKIQTWIPHIAFGFAIPLS